MNQVVTLTGFETKTGSNDSGGWTLYLFSSAGGAKYQTFDDDLGRAGAQLINQAADVEYDVQEREYTDKTGQKRTGQNNVLRSIKASTGGAAAPESTVILRPTPQFTADRPIRSHETNRSDALGHAVKAVGEVNDPQELFALANAFVSYIEEGAAAFTPEEAKF